MRLWAGDVYPGTFLHWGHNDHWWIDFAELATGRVEGTSDSARELREAIRIARVVLANHQGPSERDGWMRTQLVHAGMPVNEPKSAAHYPLDLGLSRDRIDVDG